MSLPASNLDWILVLDDDEFRRIVERFSQFQLTKLRSDLTDKARSISEALAEPHRLNRDGYPMLESERDDWQARAEKALICTEKQLQVVNTLIWESTNHGLSRPVLRRVLDLAMRGADFGNPSTDDANALRLLRHHLGDR